MGEGAWMTTISVGVQHNAPEGTDPREAPVVTALFDAAHETGDQFGAQVGCVAETVPAATYEPPENERAAIVRLLRDLSANGPSIDARKALSDAADAPALREGAVPYAIEAPPSPRKGAARYSPLDPVALGATAACPNQSDHVDGAPVLSALVGTNAELMEAVARLWITPTDVVVDSTYGRGVFWRNIPGLPTYRYDAKQGDDLRCLPLPDGIADVLVLDPPYRPAHGSTGFGRNGLSEAYGLGGPALDSITDVLELYEAGITEAARVLKSGGRLMVKCQDITYGNRLHLASLDVLRLLARAGFDLVDQFILVNQTRLGSPKWKRQERARRAHSVLWVAIRPAADAIEAGEHRQ